MIFQDRVELPLWEGPAPLAHGSEPGKDIPTITMYMPPQWKRYDKAVVIFPGGGYSALAGHEGKGYAEYLAANGIWAFVVNYRLGSHGYAHPAELYDAARGVRMVRLAAKTYGYSPDKVGVMGSSAGGHLAAHCSTSFSLAVPGADETKVVSSRPDFTILCYPVISGISPKRHFGSFQNLLCNKEPSQKDLESVSAELLAGPDTPPAFLWHTFEDKGVPYENSLLYAERLRSYGISVEMHIYAKGGHGMGLNGGHPWGEACLFWLSMI